MVTVGDKLASNLVRALEEKEAQLDNELQQMDKWDEDDYERVRSERLDSMKKAHANSQALKRKGHGSYQELFGDKEFFQACKDSTHVAVHFFRESTWRCKVLDKHMEELAKRHISCRFAKINAEKAPYLCDKLRIMMMPTLVLVKEGHTEHSIIGFDEFGGVDDFETEVIEERLAAWGMYTLKN